MALTNPKSHVENGDLLSLLTSVVAQEATLRAEAVAEGTKNKADKATTLAGYGIADAYTQSETDQKIADAITGADLDKYVEKKDGYDLVSATDVAQIGTNKAAIETLNGAETVTGSVAKSIADAINDFATKISDDGTINTFKELIDYAAAHQGEYSTLSGEVQANTTAIGVLNGDENTAGSVAKAVKDAVATSASDLTDAIDAVADDLATNYTKTADLPKSSTPADMTEIFAALYPTV